MTRELSTQANANSAEHKIREENQLSARERALYQQFRRLMEEKKRDSAAITRLLTKPDFPFDVWVPYDGSPIQMVCKAGLVHAAIAAVESGCPLNSELWGDLPLNVACESLMPELAYILLNKGASVTDYEPASSPLLQACRNGLEELALTMIDRGAPIDSGNCNDDDLRGWRSPLLVACEKDMDRVAMKLVQLGAPLDVRKAKYDYHGSPLHIACHKNMRDVALHMVEKGAPLDDAQNKHLLTPLHIACQNGLADVALAMIERGAPLDVYHYEFGKQDTPLQAALEQVWNKEDRMESVILAMIKKGAPLNVNHGVQPLDTAVTNCSEAIVTAMIEHGASLSRGQSIANYMKACERGFELAALAMISNGLAKEGGHDSRDLLANVIGDKQDLLLLALLGKNPELITSYYNITAVDGASDMLRQFAQHVLLPALYLDVAGPKPSFTQWENAIEKAFWPYSIRPTAFDLPEDQLSIVDKTIETLRHSGKTANEILSTIKEDPRTLDLLRQISRQERLADCWHHEAITLPKTFLPLLTSREWQPLFSPTFTASNGLSIRPLTSSAELDEESEKLDHCVGRSAGYDESCCSADSHILSIYHQRPDGQRQPVSTLEIELIPQPSHFADEKQKPDEITIAIGPESKTALKVRQHYGYRNHTAPQEALLAWEEFAKQVQEGKIAITLNEESLGETAASKKIQAKYSKIERYMGYHPTKESVNALFDRFRMTERAATLGRNHQGQRIYDTVQSEDGYTHFEHFIDGYAVLTKEGKPTGRTALRANHLKLNEGERIISLRDLDVDNWLDATGLRTRLRDAIDGQLTEKTKWKKRPDIIDITPRLIIDERPRPQIANRFLTGHISKPEVDKSTRFVK